MTIGATSWTTALESCIIHSKKTSSISFQNKTCVHRLGLSCFLGSARGSISGKSEREARGDAAAPEDSGELDGRGDEPMAGEVCAAPARSLPALGLGDCGS